MKKVVANVLYTVVGFIAFGVTICFFAGLDWLFQRIWALYTDSYFIAVNRTLLGIAVAILAWWFGRGIVRSWNE